MKVGSSFGTLVYMLAQEEIRLHSGVNIVILSKQKAAFRVYFYYKADCSQPCGWSQWLGFPSVLFDIYIYLLFLRLKQKGS